MPLRLPAPLRPRAAGGRALARRTATARRIACGWRLLLALPAASSASFRPAAAQDAASSRGCVPLPAAQAAAVAAGWTAYRAGRIAEADERFAGVLARCPEDVGARNGLGYAALRAGRVDSAAATFRRALAAAPDDYDALAGLGMAAWRAGDHAATRRAFTRALAVVPGDSVSAAYLARLPEDLSAVRLPPVQRPETVQVAARVGRRVLEVPDGRGGWRPLWWRGLNVGAARPGRHPSEFPPDDGTYERWLALAAEMHVNVLRVYTVHPPHFYRALERWNTAHPEAPLWLVHGVWTELPPGELEERYDDPAWRGEFLAEMRHVVDLLHGHAVIPHRPGHAGGVYTADVSRWTLAYIIGREWEPYSVAAYNAAHPADASYAGRYFTVAGGNALEVWLAAFCDALAAYEMDTYHAQRPIAYTNWPTLDPLHHPTEATRAEEDALYRRLGARPTERSREYDNDAEALDATRMRPTAAFPAGTFASYHAYPYYPDFLVLDPGYRAARAPEGPSAYYGYLRALVEHHGDMPVVISEYGVPSSRGNAHVQPQGWHHGGHSEQAQAEIDARLTRDIHAAGAAGAVLFAIIDEWFKKNWVVIDFEQPLERNRLWYNALDAEQNYGVLAMRPGPADSALVVDGAGADWGARGRWYDDDHHASGAASPLAPGDPRRLRALRVRHDEGYVHLRLDVDAIDWSRARYLIGIDTYADSLGGLRLPRTGTRAPVGLEFVVDLAGPDSAWLRTTPAYNLYRQAPIEGMPGVRMNVYNRPFRTIADSSGRWETVWVETNRQRLGRDGTVFPRAGVDRGRLLHARETETTLADWYADSAAGIIELRLPWGMLHVLDPSSRTVLQGSSDAAHAPEGAPTDGFRFVVESYSPRDPGGGGDRLPRAEAGGWGAVPTWSWPTWEEPRWHERRKPAVAAMRDAFRRLEAEARARTPADATAAAHGGGRRAPAPPIPD